MNRFEKKLRDKGICDERVIAAMLQIPREAFIPIEMRSQAYEDYPLPIGNGQTISQPSMVALMTEMLSIEEGQKILEIGTGCGYQTAILGKLGAIVYTIEILENLAKRARKTLESLAIKNIHFRISDGYWGWNEESPFDALILTAAPPKLPKTLIDQTKTGGDIVVPEGVGDQWLHHYEIDSERHLRNRASVRVRFVPMVGGENTVH